MSSHRPPAQQETIHFDFLIYAPRSGSTHLARLISDAYPHVAVLPEFRLPEFLFAAGDGRVRAMPPRRLTAMATADRQLRGNLDLTDDDIHHAVSCGRAGIAALVASLLNSYLRRRGMRADRCLLKLGRAAGFADEIARVFPGARYVHCVRDGRAVVNSLLRTPKAYFPGESMGRDDIVWSAKVWRDHIRQVEALVASDASPVTTIRYEALVASPATEVARLANVLGAGGTRWAPPFGLSERERVLHPMAYQKSAPERAYGWTVELAARDGAVAEFLMRRELANWDYAPYFLRGPISGAQQRAIVLAQMHHMRRSFQRLGKRAYLYRHRRGEVLQHLAVSAKLGRRS